MNNLNLIICAISAINAKGKSEEIRALPSSIKPYLTPFMKWALGSSVRSMLI